MRYEAAFFCYSMLALLVGETGKVNETPKRYTRAKITYLALLMFFSSLVCGVLFYRRGGAAFDCSYICGKRIRYKHVRAGHRCSAIKAATIAFSNATLEHYPRR